MQDADRGLDLLGLDDPVLRRDPEWTIEVLYPEDQRRSAADREVVGDAHLDEGSKKLEDTNRDLALFEGASRRRKEQPAAVHIRADELAARHASLDQRQGHDILARCGDHRASLRPEHHLLLRLALDPAEEPRAVLENELVHLAFASWRGSLRCWWRLCRPWRRDECQGHEKYDRGDMPGSHVLHKAHSSGREAHES